MTDFCYLLDQIYVGRFLQRCYVYILFHQLLFKICHQFLSMPFLRSAMSVLSRELVFSSCLIVPWSSISIWWKSPKLGLYTSGMTSDSTPVGEEAIKHASLCFGEIPSSKVPCSVPSLYLFLTLSLREKLPEIASENLLFHVREEQIAELIEQVHLSWGPHPILPTNYSWFW